MFEIHVPTVILLVAAPMSWAVAITSLLTSAAKIASNPRLLGLPRDCLHLAGAPADSWYHGKREPFRHDHDPP
jgi:hypothetical protein